LGPALEKQTYKVGLFWGKTEKANSTIQMKRIQEGDGRKKGGSLVGITNVG